ncbi:MAG: type II toxin-antitoxin system RelE/ParE family toxin [Synechococcaceae cyanobacterium ELA263]
MTSDSEQPPQRYEVRLARRAVRSLANLQRRDQQRIRAAIDLLAENPRPPSCVALQGEAGVYRVRVGDYRIVYEVFDRVLVVQVVRIGHRREVYR